MGLNRFRNKPCKCGSGIKFKHCCLQDHYEQQAGLVTKLAKKVQEKTVKYFQKRYKKITNEGEQEWLMNLKILKNQQINSTMFW